VDAALHLAWGLTLGFSHDDKQVEMGKIFNRIFENFEKNLASDPEKRRYFDNFASFLSTFLRSIGFERSVYFDYLNTQNKKRDEIIKNLNEIADVTSFSQEGTIIRIGSFFGIGSLAEFISRIIPGTTSTLPIELGAILFGGFIGLILVTVVLKILRGRLVQKAIGDALQKQQWFWTQHARPNYKHSLEHLFQDLQRLVEKEYSAYADSGEENVLSDWRIVDPLIEDILPPINLYELPPEPKRKSGSQETSSAEPKVPP
jgi:hypothetical protein